jgi:class 3 adenylate cyclase/tetratricopeptide (TPR) repeat protein
MAPAAAPRGQTPAIAGSGLAAVGVRARPSYNPAVAVCASCGEENPDRARFCLACGTALAAEAPAREERKVVTVLFADLVGFTSQAEKLDPEDVRRVLRSYHERLRSELERFGGTVEKFIGDAVMAVFGAPVAHEDDPERAVRAALAIREAMADDSDLHVRIGINTGEALVALGARPAEGEGMVSGDVVNTAARLQAAAPIDGILVGEMTYRATERAIAYRKPEAVPAKGKEQPVASWAALQPRAALGVDVTRTVRAPLVGRERELEALVAALHRTRGERSAQLLTLVGVPGIGKSRLVYELLATVERDAELVYWRQGRSLPYGEGVAFWALAEMVKAHAGILETDTSESAGDKLRAMLADLALDNGESRWVEGHLRPLVGLAAEADGRGDRQAEEFAAWRRLFEALAERRPLVLVFEDLHWADEGLLDFVDHLVDWASGVPVLVVCTARPELLVRRPGWGGGKPNAATISLSPLTDEDTARLLARLVGRAVLPAEAQSRLLAHAGGNPLYAEEYARMHGERGDVETLALPETVQGIIAARLDALSVDEKELLQDAGVLGKVFWLGALVAVGGRKRWAVEQLLHGLERREFVRRERRSSVGNETEYAFRHLLVRDVAYGQIPRALRADKHRRAAEWIESLAADRGEKAEMLANHYLAAFEFARASSQPTTDLSEYARVALREAGDRAAGLGAFAAAARSYGAALELWPEDDPGRPELLFRFGRAQREAHETGAEELAEARDALVAAGNAETAAEAEILLCELAWHQGRHDRAFEHLHRASEMVRDVPASPSKAYVLSNLSRFHMLADEDDRAIDFGRQALEMAEALGLDEIQAHALNNIGTLHAKIGDTRGVVELERSIAVATRINSPEAIRGYNNLAACLHQLGELARMAELETEGRRLAERFGLSPWLRWFGDKRATLDYCSGRWEEALRFFDEQLAAVEAGPPHYLEGVWRKMRAKIAIARGETEGAARESARALEAARRVKDPQVLFPELAWAANAFLTIGRSEEAGALIDELLALWVAGGLKFGPEWVVDLAEVMLELGRGDEFLDVTARVETSGRWLEVARAYVDGDLGRAADLFAGIGALPDEARARVRLAELLAAEGRRREADEQLGRALAFFRRVGATAYVREAEALLRASA